MQLELFSTTSAATPWTVAVARAQDRPPVIGGAQGGWVHPWLVPSGTRADGSWTVAQRVDGTLRRRLQAAR